MYASSDLSYKVSLQKFRVNVCRNVLRIITPGIHNSNFMWFTKYQGEVFRFRRKKSGQLVHLVAQQQRADIFDDQRRNVF